MEIENDIHSQLEKLGSDIRAEAARQKMDKADIKELTGIDARTIQRVMDGNGGVSIGMCVIVALALGKTIKVGDK